MLISRTTFGSRDRIQRPTGAAGAHAEGPRRQKQLRRVRACTPPCNKSKTWLRFIGCCMLATTRAADYLMLASGVAKPGHARRAVDCSCSAASSICVTGARRNPPPAGVEDTNVEVRVTVTEPPEVTTQARSRVDWAECWPIRPRWRRPGGAEFRSSPGRWRADLSARRQYFLLAVEWPVAPAGAVFDSLGGR